jgi:SAM-dependent methyltransferase
MSAKADYDELWSETWGQMQDIGPVHRHTTRIILDTMRPLHIQSVLDVGCGNGANLAAIQREFGLRDIVGLDVSAPALEIARTRVDGELILKDLEKDVPLGRTFDFVLSSQVVEHLHDDDGFLAKLRAMTGQYVLVGTMQGRMRDSEAHIGHLRNYTRAGLVAKMERNGFAVSRVIEWGFPFFSPIYRSLIELVGGQAAEITYSKRDRVVASLLYQLYRLNTSRHGDVLMILGRAV